MTKEEAIRILASSCIPGSKQTEALEALIPELRESEDERIRKWLVNLLHELHYNQTAHPMALKAVEWLEKQKEQKPAEWNEEELGRKHLEGYCMGREDTLREMKDFIESHFNCENAKKGTPIVYNTQSGTSTLKAEG